MTGNDPRMMLATLTLTLNPIRCYGRYGMLCNATPQPRPPIASPQKQFKTFAK